MTDPLPAGAARNLDLAEQEQRRAEEQRRKAQHLRRRHARERRFQALGLSAIVLTALVVLGLLGTIIYRALPAFTHHYLVLAPFDAAQGDALAGASDTDYRAVLRGALGALIPSAQSRSQRRALGRLLASGADILLAGALAGDRHLLSDPGGIPVPLSDEADLYLKGFSGRQTVLGGTFPVQLFDEAGAGARIVTPAAQFAPVREEKRQRLAELQMRLLAEIESLRRSETALGLARREAKERVRSLPRGGADDTQLRGRTGFVEQAQKALAARLARVTTELEGVSARLDEVDERLQLTASDPSVFVRIAGGILKIEQIIGDNLSGPWLLHPSAQGLPSGQQAGGGQANALTPGGAQHGTAAQAHRAGSWSIILISSPEAERKVSDAQIAWLEHLRAQGLVERRVNTLFFTRSASREAEMAGILGAVVGSFLTLLVTLCVAFPVGVSAAIYLQEFAPKNRLTMIIEVNINNLAAVPSIVFGLLGLAVFLNFFGLPRSAPLVGGFVLGLMTLPTIIIASRAALGAVPPSIREAALAIGASRMQSVFHHVLPAALPGVLTGSIIGMAQALGETAPLLMIGMVAFVVDVPSGFTDPATALPVQIYMWADFPEFAFSHKAAAAIVVLLAFLILMNGTAIYLRRRFEQRW